MYSFVLSMNVTTKQARLRGLAGALEELNIASAKRCKTASVQTAFEMNLGNRNNGADSSPRKRQ